MQALAQPIPEDAVHFGAITQEKGAERSGAERNGTEILRGVSLSTCQCSKRGRCNKKCIRPASGQHQSTQQAAVHKLLALSHLVEHHTAAAERGCHLAPPAVELCEVHACQLWLRLAGRGMAGMLVVSDDHIAGVGEACTTCSSKTREHGQTLLPATWSGRSAAVTALCRGLREVFVRPAG